MSIIFFSVSSGIVYENLPSTRQNQCKEREVCFCSASTSWVTLYGKNGMDEDKLGAMKEWRAPTSVSELPSFLGLAN